MKTIKGEDILNLFPPDEGSIDQYYGRIGNGKTYAATADAYADLKRGQTVYANWQLQWKGYDERNSVWCQLLGILGLKKTFRNFPVENFQYMPIDGTFHQRMEQLTDCTLYLDEGHIVFDSYEMAKMSIERRAAVLHTRHFNRKIKIISQRPTAIHVTLRANVNRFFKCEKIFSFLGLVIFRKTEYQDLAAGETVDEDQAVYHEYYRGRKEIFAMYDTKYLRNGKPRSQPNYAELNTLSYRERLQLAFPGKKKNEVRYKPGPLMQTPPLPIPMPRPPVDSVNRA